MDHSVSDGDVSTSPPSLTSEDDQNQMPASPTTLLRLLDTPEFSPIEQQHHRDKIHGMLRIADETPLSLSPLDWKQRWYPLSLSKDLGLREVVGLTLLNEALCLFRNHQGQAVCLEDRCALSGCPLSLAQWKEGGLECRCYKWMLDDQGRVHVPQSFTETSMAAADRKVRKEDSDASVFNTQRVRVFPCQERNGLIWVWPGPIASANTSLIQSNNKIMSACAIDMDLDHCLILEHLMTAFYSMYPSTPTVCTESDSENQLLVASSISSDDNRKRSFQLSFRPPFQLELRCTQTKSFLFRGFSSALNEEQWTWFCIPIRPGHCRLIQIGNQTSIWSKITSAFVTDPPISFCLDEDYPRLKGQQASRKRSRSPQLLANPWVEAYRHWLQSSEYQTDETFTADLDWRIPCQRCVDNSAYTWRQDVLLGRGMNDSRPMYIYRYSAAAGLVLAIAFIAQRSNP